MTWLDKMTWQSNVHENVHDWTKWHDKVTMYMTCQKWVGVGCLSWKMGGSGWEWLGVGESWWEWLGAKFSKAPVRPPLEILQLFSETASRGVYLKHSVIFTGKHLCWDLFFNKVAGHAGHQSCKFIKKRLQHRFFLVNMGKFIKTSILKNICERLHFWKVFCKNIFQIRT